VARYRTLDDLQVKGRRVLVRADLNVPMKEGRVTDATRIERQALTIRELAAKGARVIVLSHFDRPKGKVVPTLSLRPVAEPLAKAVGRPVNFAEDCIGQKAQDAVAQMKDGDVLVLENTRFHAGEEKNDAEFAGQLAKLGDIYVNDAFSAAHRAHASTDALARLLPSAAGRSMQAELQHLDEALSNPERPLMAVVGGAKVSTKIALLENLVRRVNVLVIGGAMANTFLAAQGKPIGKSLHEPEQLETAGRIVGAAVKSGAKVLLPTDVVVAARIQPDPEHRTVSVDEVASNELILDVGPASVEAMARELQNIKTLVWNGPLGAFEMPPFERGTVALAKRVAARSKERKLISVAGGGDTVAALRQAGVEGDFTYVSTAGGAFLQWLEGKTLPGVAALEQKR
jgi:phosphoglycerate kinase